MSVLVKRIIYGHY